MKRSIQLVALFIGLMLACKPEVDCGCVMPPLETDSQLTGRWELVKITPGYGPTLQSITPAEAGYTESFDFKADNTFLRVRNGQVTETGKYRTGENLRKVAYEKAIYYLDQKEIQPYSVSNGRLFMYDRMPQDASLADGATYEFVKK